MSHCASSLGGFAKENKGQKKERKKMSTVRNPVFESNLADLDQQSARSDQVDQAQRAMHRLRTNLLRAMRELHNLAQPIHDAIKKGTASERDWKTLDEELQNLRERKLKYEASVDTFKVRWEEAGGLQEAIDEADSELDETLEAYLNIKLQLDNLLRKVDIQLTGQESHNDVH